MRTLVSLQGCDELDTGKLCVLIGIKDLRAAKASQRRPQSVNAEVRRRRVGESPGEHLPGEPVNDGDEVHKAASHREWSERPAVVELFAGLSSPNRTCTFQRIRLSI